jgi:hypothetical protein
MDNLLEILIPLIFAAIYFFGNMFSGKSPDEDGPPELPRQQGRDAEDVEAAERQRRIQEEIRRKIMERRQASGGEGPVRPAASGYDLLERHEKPAQVREVIQRQPESTPPPLAVPTHQSAERTSSSTFSWDQSDNIYQNSMEDRLKQIEATKRRAEKLKREADAAHMRTDRQGPARRTDKNRRYFSGPVRESLQDPAAARMAFIYGEVLGRPISQREKSSSVPGLS